MEILKYNLSHKTSNPNYTWLQYMASRFNNQRYSVCMLVDWEYCELSLYQQTVLSALYNIDFCYCMLPPLFNSYDILIIGSTNTKLIQSYMELFGKENGLVCVPNQTQIQAQMQVLKPRPGFNERLAQTKASVLKPTQQGAIYCIQNLGLQTIEIEAPQLKSQFETLKIELELLSGFKNGCADKKYI